MSLFDMSKEERSRKNASRILRQLARHGQKPVADALGVSESTISRMKDDGKFNQLADILTEIGLKVVPDDSPVVERKKFDAILTLAGDYLDKANNGDVSLWDGEG